MRGRNGPRCADVAVCVFEILKTGSVARVEVRRKAKRWSERRLGHRTTKLQLRRSVQGKAVLPRSSCVLARAAIIDDERADGQPVHHWRADVPSLPCCLVAECSRSVSSWRMSESVIERTCGARLRPWLAVKRSQVACSEGQASCGSGLTTVTRGAFKCSRVLSKVFVAGTSIDWRYSIHEYGRRDAQPKRSTARCPQRFHCSEAFRLDGFREVSRNQLPILCLYYPRSTVVRA